MEPTELGSVLLRAQAAIARAKVLTNELEPEESGSSQANSPSTERVAVEGDMFTVRGRPEQVLPVDVSPAIPASPPASLTALLARGQSVLHSLDEQQQRADSLAARLASLNAARTSGQRLPTVPLDLPPLLPNPVNQGTQTPQQPDSNSNSNPNFESRSISGVGARSERPEAAVVELVGPINTPGPPFLVGGGGPSPSPSAVLPPRDEAPPVQPRQASRPVDEDPLRRWRAIVDDRDARALREQDRLAQEHDSLAHVLRGTASAIEFAADEFMGGTGTTARSDPSRANPSHVAAVTRAYASSAEGDGKTLNRANSNNSLSVEVVQAVSAAAGTLALSHASAPRQTPSITSTVSTESMSAPAGTYADATTAGNPHYTWPVIHTAAGTCADARAGAGTATDDLAPAAQLEAGAVEVEAAEASSTARVVEEVSVHQALQLLSHSLGDMHLAAAAIHAGRDLVDVANIAETVSRADARAEEVSRMARQLLSVLREFPHQQGQEEAQQAARARPGEEPAGFSWSCTGSPLLALAGCCAQQVQTRDSWTCSPLSAVMLALAGFPAYPYHPTTQQVQTRDIWTCSPLSAVMLALAGFPLYPFYPNHLNHPNHPAGATEEQLDLLPTVSCHAGSSWLDSDEAESCGICLSEYQIGDRLKSTNVDTCSHHHFHASCLDEWVVADCADVKRVVADAADVAGCSRV
eukprot:gene27884-12000_t